MANSDSTLNELSNLIARLRGERKAVAQKLAGIDEQVKAVEMTMRLIRHNGKQAEPDVYDSLVARLKEDRSKGKITQTDALIAIATKGNGSFKVGDAKRIMLEAELIATPKNAFNIIYTLMARSEKFEKVKPGEYRLVGAQQSLPGVN